MVKNILLELEYDGSAYFGWQIQLKKKSLGEDESPKRKEAVKTVQGELEKALRKLFNKEIRVIYAGRTDRGVHAKQQVVNFHIDTKIPLPNIKKALNSFLPSDIRIKKVKQVPLYFCLRSHIHSKVYRYIIFNTPSPSVFLRNYTWFIPDKLDIEKMRKAAEPLVGYRDFSMFTKGASLYKDCRRNLKSISIKKRRGFIYIDIEADGFLRNMARNIVFFLVEVGRGKFTLKEAKQIIQGKKGYTKKPAPPQGLYLYRVKYK